MSHRNDTNVPYDLSILSTLAERQGDYNIDLLDEGHDRTAANPPDRRAGAMGGYSPGAIALAHKEGQLEDSGRIAKKASWYRTTWGITTIVIIIILIIGGVVGGAVGGTQHSSSHNSNGNSTNGSGHISGPSSVTTGASLGGGPASATTTIVSSEITLSPTTTAGTTSSPSDQVPQGPTLQTTASF